MEHEFVIAVIHAAELHEVAVHMEHSLASGAFVQVVNILRHEQKVVTQALLEFGECNMGGVWLVVWQTFAQKIIEIHDALRVTAKSAGSAYVLDVLVFPHPVVAAECAQTRFGANACACQYYEFYTHKAPLYKIM